MGVSGRSRVAWDVLGSPWRRIIVGPDGIGRTSPCYGRSRTAVSPSTGSGQGLRELVTVWLSVLRRLTEMAWGRVRHAYPSFNGLVEARL